MRIFTLYNSNRTSSFSLNQDSIKVTDVQGLGTNINNSYQSVNNRRNIINTYLDFEDITLSICFGIVNNAYTDYYSLLHFIQQNNDKDLVLKYEKNYPVDTSGFRYCKLRLKNAPKTQKDTTGTMTLDFVFVRLTPWYKDMSQTPMRKGTNYYITNYFCYPVPLDITFFGQITSPKTITMTPRGGTAQRVTVKSVPANSNLTINGETKKVSLSNGTDAYDLIDHIGNTFLLLPPGESTFIVSTDDTSDNGQVTVFTRNYFLD